MNADGTGIKQVTDMVGNEHAPSWSPDGAQIVFSSNRGGQRQLWIMNADGSDQRPLTDPSFEAWDPVWVKYPDS